MTCILSLWRSGRGSVLPLVGLALLVLILSVGIAVDTGRVSMVQSKLNTAIDAAGLAAGATVDAEDPAAEVAKYFYANYPQNYLGSTVTSLTADSNQDNTTITVNATATVPTVFMQIVGVDHLTVSATSQITRATSGLELALVLDNTGSMNQSVGGGGGVNKITALKSAATDLINILYGANITQQNLWVGLVPFTQAVNIGTGHPSWMNAAYDHTLNWGPTTWMGCVMSRTSPDDIVDDPPSVQKFEEYYSPNSAYNQWIIGSGRGAIYNISSTTGPNAYCPQQVTPMTADKTTILNGINSMVANGDTLIDIGLAWGWRMLSPRWRGLWGGEMNANGLPLDYNLPFMNKAVVLMTDGENNFSPGNYTAYAYLSDGQLGTTNFNAANSALDQRTLQVCTDMKNNGIVIYTIGFGSGSQINTGLLQACASKPSFFFLAPTNADLSAAFHMIGDSLANLRVSK